MRRPNSFKIAVLCAVVLLTLPLLVFGICGAIQGTFDMFPRPEEQDGVERAIYATFALLLGGLDIALIRYIRRVWKARGRTH